MEKLRRSITFEIFNINEDYLVNHLNISGVDVTGQEYGNASNFKNGNNVKGHGLRPYDVSVDLGTSGIGKDTVNGTFFVLESTTGVGLTLDLIAQVEFSSRTTSVGQRITAIAPAAPDAIDDVIIANEDTATSQDSPNSNLIANDTDMDGDILTIVAVNGDNTLAGRQFTLSTGGLLIVNNSGNFDFDRMVDMKIWQTVKQGLIVSRTAFQTNWLTRIIKGLTRLK
jgi:hypothetical protein